MSFPTPSPAPSGEPHVWVPLEEAAAALRLSQQTLWQRLQELRIEVARLERDGRRVSAVSREDMQRLAGSNVAVRPAPEPAAPAAASRERELPPPTANGLAQRSLWQQLRELEVQRDNLDFELRLMRVQLGDSRARAQQAEESLRLVRADLDLARTEAFQLRERYEPLQIEHSRDSTSLVLERDRRASVERQLAKLIEIEEARERYCDRLEQRIHVLRRLARGA